MSKLNGFSLMEVVISMALMAILLMSISAARVYAVREATNSYFYLAAIKQQEMLAVALQQTPYHQWPHIYQVFNKQLKLILPNGRLTVLEENGIKRIVINWGQLETSDCRQKKMGRSGCVSYLLVE